MEWPDELEIPQILESGTQIQREYLNLCRSHFASLSGYDFDDVFAGLVLERLYPPQLHGFSLDELAARGNRIRSQRK